MEQTSKAYVTGPKVQVRYDVTKMTIWRWENDPKLGFPKPIRINKRKYWAEDELDAWDLARVTGVAA